LLHHTIVVSHWTANTPISLHSLSIGMTTSTKHVAVIGAGISGVVAAAHLKKEGLEVTVFERSSAAGGIWYIDARSWMRSNTDYTGGFMMTGSL
jgi:monoamine oxidase